MISASYRSVGFHCYFTSFQVIVYVTGHVSLNVCIKVEKKKEYNSSYSELGPPVNGFPNRADLWLF